MPTLPTLALFFLASLGLLLIPGPSVLYIMTRSVEQGKRAGLSSVLGKAELKENARATHAICPKVSNSVQKSPGSPVAMCGRKP